MILRHCAEDAGEYSHFELRRTEKLLDALAAEVKGDAYYTYNVTKTGVGRDHSFNQLPDRNGGDDGTRTRGLCRDSLAIHGLSAT